MCDHNEIKCVTKLQNHLIYDYNIVLLHTFIMNKNTRIISIISLITAGSICTSIAQRPPAAPQPARDSRTHSPQENSASVFGSEIPQLDFTNKTFEHGGKTHSMSDNHIAGQFEAYLSTDTLLEQDAIEYRKTIRDILDLLAYDKTGGSKLKSAHKLLSKAAEYPGDANICESLANAIFSAQLSSEHIGKRRAQAKKLKKERARLYRNLMVLGGHEQLSKSAKGAKPQVSAESSHLKKSIAEIEATLKAIEINGIMGRVQSKLHFQSMIVQLFAQRRFQHCIMATRFYMLIYKDGDAKLELKKGADTEKIFSETLGVNPTINGIDAASAEIIKKVETLVNSFNNNLKKNKIHAASERLMEAFFIGEFLPALHTIPLKDKAPIQQYVQDANDLVRVLVANDLERAETLNLSLQKQASDYNPSEAKSYIAGRKNDSKFNTRDAKFALRFMMKSNNADERRTEQARFKAAMARAVKAWPSNPELELLNKAIDTKFDEVSILDNKLLVARKDFDRYVETKSWAAVMKDENLSRFLASFHLSTDIEDVARANKLKQIKEEFSSMFATLKEAETYYKRGHVPAAWELVDIAIKKHKDSIELAQAKALYSGKASNFSNTISQAQELEKKAPQSAHALSYFLKAEKIYPNSKYAREGIQRIISAKFKPNRVNADQELSANH